MKNKQKTAYDKHLTKPMSFDIGQKKGPYRIREILINRSYHLREEDGCLLAKPVNGDLLKSYFDQWLWEPQI
ncbi:1063_t:CDS:2, partial [Funneliformis caledonium]